MSASKPRVLLYGNCQGEWLFQALAGTPEITQRYELHFLFNFQAWPADHPIHDPEFLRSCAWVIWQTASGQKPPEWLARLGPGGRQFRFPTLWLKMLWPTNATDPRNQPEPAFPWGRFANGDRLIQKFIAEGVPIEDMPKRYVDTDLNSVVNLDRYREMTLAELRYIDKQSDVQMASFIEKEVSKRRLFGTINHPTFLLLNRLQQAMTAALLDRSLPADLLPPDNAGDYIGQEEVPVHPQLIRHFGLAWARPDIRWRFRSAFLTLDEYVKAYAAFTPIPAGSSAQQSMARANQAVQLGDIADAKRLLLEAASVYPQHAQFLQFLGLLLLQRGELHESEKVYRYALTQHPTLASLHSKLGIVLARRGYPAEAKASFRQALALDPSLAEAKGQLAATP